MFDLVVNAVAIIAKASFGEEEISGKGETAEEAIENCLRQIRGSIQLWKEIAEDICLPLEVAERMPKEIPDGFSLVVFSRYPLGRHDDGKDWRFIAIPTGGVVTSPGMTDRKITKAIEEVSHLGQQYFGVPPGSLEFVRSGKWVPIQSGSVVYKC